MPRLDIDDGYTLDGATESTVRNPAGDVIAENLPVVAFRYRPALPEALAEWRYSVRMAKSGADEVAAAAKLVCDHLVTWDVTAGGKPAPLAAEFVKKVPELILDQIVRAVSTWAPKSEEAAGNSPAG